MNDRYTVVLEGLEIFAFHGCHKEEQVLGSNFRVDIYLEISGAEQSDFDHLEDTVDYEQVYRLVVEEMQTRSELIEQVAKRVIKKMLQTFSRIQRIKVRITKLHLPLGNTYGQSAVEMTLDR